MKIILKVKEWRWGEWQEREVTFHKVPQKWQSANGDLFIELKEVMTV